MRDPASYFARSFLVGDRARCMPTEGGTIEQPATEVAGLNSPSRHGFLLAWRLP
jgi:hypothetical protein